MLQNVLTMTLMRRRRSSRYEGAVICSVVGRKSLVAWRLSGWLAISALPGARALAYAHICLDDIARCAFLVLPLSALILCAKAAGGVFVCARMRTSHCANRQNAASAGVPPNGRNVEKRSSSKWRREETK